MELSINDLAGVQFIKIRTLPTHCCDVTCSSVNLW